MDAAGHVHDVEVVVAVDGNGAGLVEFADAGAAAADDFDGGKEFAVEGRLRLIAAEEEGEEEDECEAQFHASSYAHNEQVENAKRKRIVKGY